jgi:uncharacterized membrane protein YqjE
MAGLIEIAFIYIVALAFGIWQLISVRREIRKDKEVRKDEQN